MPRFSLHSIAFALLAVLPAATVAGADEEPAETVKPIDPDPLIVHLRFSLDDRDPMDAVHVEEVYGLQSTGAVFDVTHATNRGHMASRNRKLDDPTRQAVLCLCRALPASHDDVAAENRVIIEFLDENRPRRRVYDRTRLPKLVGTIVDLLGGWRRELESQVQLAVPEPMPEPETGD